MALESECWDFLWGKIRVVAGNEHEVRLLDNTWGSILSSYFVLWIHGVVCCENSSGCILMIPALSWIYVILQLKMVLLKNVVVDWISICVFNQDALICEFRNMQGIITLVTQEVLRTLVPRVIHVLWKLWKLIIYIPQMHISF